MIHQLWQKRNDLREKRQEARANNECQQERHHSDENLLKRDILSYAVDHINVDPHRRLDNSHLGDKNDYHPEPDGIKSEVEYDGVKDGNSEDYSKGDLNRTRTMNFPEIILLPPGPKSILCYSSP